MWVKRIRRKSSWLTSAIPQTTANSLKSPPIWKTSSQSSKGFFYTAFIKNTHLTSSKVSNARFGSSVATSPSLMSWLHVELSYHMETSACASPLRTWMRALLVVFEKDDGVDVKAKKPVLPHGDGSAHSQLLSWARAPSVSQAWSPVSPLLSVSLPAAHRPSHCSPGHSLRITFPSAPHHDLMRCLLHLSYFCLTGWGLSQATARSAGNQWYCSSAFVLHHLSEHISL